MFPEPDITVSANDSPRWRHATLDPPPLGSIVLGFTGDSILLAKYTRAKEIDSDDQEFGWYLYPFGYWIDSITHWCNLPEGLPAPF
jgi:hypothetical protein